jgi:hypothetical protein
MQLMEEKSIIPFSNIQVMIAVLQSIVDIRMKIEDPICI